MPEATSAGGGYSCQVCGTTYPTETELIQHGRDQHPDKPVSWGDTRGEATTTTSTTRTEEAQHEAGEKVADVKRGMEDAGDKIKAGAKAVGSKMSDPDKDLKAEYEQKKAEERTK